MRQFKNTKKITERNNISVNNYLKEVIVILWQQ